MLELLDFDRLEEILVLIIPGFVSLKVWTLINPTARLKLADYLLDIIAFSALNFAALSWLLAITTDSPLWLRIIVGVGVFYFGQPSTGARFAAASYTLIPWHGITSFAKGTRASSWYTSKTAK